MGSIENSDQTRSKRVVRASQQGGVDPRGPHLPPMSKRACGGRALRGTRWARFSVATCCIVRLAPLIILGLRGIEWAKLGYEGARKLCIS